MLPSKYGFSIPATPQEIIKKIRVNKKYSVGYISKKLGVTPQTIRRIIDGTYQSSKMDILLIKLYCSIKINLTHARK